MFGNNMRISPEVKIMVVDDSYVIRNFFKNILEERGYQNIFFAENGKDAVDLANKVKPNIVLLDIEMPIMTGLKALPLILQVSPYSEVIMVSTLTTKNSQTALEALSLGACDYLEKPKSDQDKEDFTNNLIKKIIDFSKISKQDELEIGNKLESDINLLKKDYVSPEVLAIGSSTGGPQALSVFLEKLSGLKINYPIFITQHMPPTFTKFLADNISKITGINCLEATDGEEVVPGKIYLAPGDFHMTFSRDGLKVFIKLNQDAPENFCRPAVDVMLRSLVDVYNNKVLTVILTGMGQDGLEGAKSVVGAGGRVIAQDKATSVVWGMPGAVAKAGICSGVYPLNDIADEVINLFRGRSF